MSTPSRGVSTPPLLCAFALYRGQYCTRPHRHAGEHAPTVDEMLADLYEAGWTTCDPRTVTDGHVPWTEDQLIRQWHAMKRARARRAI